jgi:flagellar biosynthesis/type III secretory pathway protein FliH
MTTTDQGSGQSTNLGTSGVHGGVQAGSGRITPARELKSLDQTAQELRERALESGRQLTEQVKTQSVKVYRAAKARPRLTLGLTVLAGAALTAFLLRKRIPGAVEKLSAAAAGVAIAAGAPEALDRIKAAGKKAGRKLGRKAGQNARNSKLVARPLEMLEDVPDQLSDLGGRIVRLKPVRDLADRMRRIG